MWISHRIGLYILLCFYVAFLCKATGTVDKALLIRNFMNMTKRELLEIFNRRLRVSARISFNYHRLEDEYRKNFASMAAVLDRKARETVINHREELTVGEMRDLANNICPCGAKPMIDVMLEV